MNLSPQVLGFVRYLAGVAIWSASMAVLTYLSDATHLNGIADGSLAALIAGLAGMAEHSMEASGKGALFGTVIVRK